MDSELCIVARHSHSAPVDLAGMLDELGIEYREAGGTDVGSGWADRHGLAYRVVVDFRDDEPRRRLSTARHLARYLFHRDLLKPRSRARDDDSLEQRHKTQVDRIAMRILMPAALVRREFAKVGDAAVLGRAFRVPEAAMKVRLRTLGLA